MKLNFHHLLIMRHADHIDDCITVNGRAQCQTALLKILDVLKKKNLQKCILIFDQHHNRTRETAEEIYRFLNEDIDVAIFSSKDSIQQICCLGESIDSFLTQESPETPALVVFVGSCGDIPNILRMMDIFPTIYRGSELEKILGHTNYLHINELLEVQPKIPGGFNLDNIRAFVH